MTTTGAGIEAERQKLNRIVLRLQRNGYAGPDTLKSYLEQLVVYEGALVGTPPIAASHAHSPSPTSLPPVIDQAKDQLEQATRLHFCVLCHHRWDSENASAICGDCHRKALQIEGITFERDAYANRVKELEAQATRLQALAPERDKP